MSSAPLRIASRPSPLAMWQANTVGRMLNIDFEIVQVTTMGDARRDVSIMELGGVGAFAKEIQVSVLEGYADMALHSAKDLPSLSPEGLELVSVPLRGDVRDVMIGSTLEDLPQGARVGTGAQRRRAQLAALRPDLVFEELRGNIGTRLEKASQYDAIVLAHAALQRLEREDAVTQILSIDVMLPQVAQGALAIEVRADDEITKEIAQGINDIEAFNCVTAERAFLETLGGGCSVPCAAYATQVDADTLWLRALLSDPQGREVIRVEQRGTDARALGISVARELLDDKGGTKIMEMVS